MKLLMTLQMESDRDWVKDEEEILKVLEEISDPMKLEEASVIEAVIDSDAVVAMVNCKSIIEYSPDSEVSKIIISAYNSIFSSN